MQLDAFRFVNHIRANPQAPNFSCFSTFTSLCLESNASTPRGNEVVDDSPPDVGLQAEAVMTRNEAEESNDQTLSAEATNESSHEPKVFIEQSVDESHVTLTLIDEGHTIGNALRAVIARDPLVEHAGYSVPHPSENRVKLNIVARRGTSALEIVKAALVELGNRCDETSQAYETAAMERG